MPIAATVQFVVKLVECIGSFERIGVGDTGSTTKELVPVQAFEMERLLRAVLVEPVLLALDAIAAPRVVEGVHSVTRCRRSTTQYCLLSRR